MIYQPTVLAELAFSLPNMSNHEAHKALCVADRAYRNRQLAAIGRTTELTADEWAALREAQDTWLILGEEESRRRKEFEAETETVCCDDLKVGDLVRMWWGDPDGDAEVITVSRINKPWHLPMWRLHLRWARLEGHKEFDYCPYIEVTDTALSSVYIVKRAP